MNKVFEIKFLLISLATQLIFGAHLYAKGQALNIAHSEETIQFHGHEVTGENQKSLEVIILETKQIIFFYGGFSDEGYSKAMKLISKLAPNLDTYLYIQRGFGGSVKQHKKFIGEILKKCDENRGCQLTTQLAGRCSSMCITLFLSGHKRIAERSRQAELGFHRTLMKLGKRRIPIQSKRSMVRYFSKFRGVKKKFLKDNKDELFGLSGNKLSYVSEERLLNAGFAHELSQKTASREDYLFQFHGITLN